MRCQGPSENTAAGGWTGNGFPKQGSRAAAAWTCLSLRGGAVHAQWLWKRPGEAGSGSEAAIN